MGEGHRHSTRRIAIAAAVVAASAVFVTVALVSRSTGAGPVQAVATPSSERPSTASSPTPTTPPVSTATKAPVKTAESPTPKPTPTPTPTPTIEPFTGDTAVQAAVAAVDKLDAQLPADVQIGVAVQDRVTGKLVVGKYGTEEYYSASVVKLFLIDEILREKEAGTVKVSATDTDLIKRALSASDDNAMDSLWVTFDGPAILSELIESLKLTDTTAPTDPAQWGEMLTSAQDVVAVYDDVLDRLAATDRNLVMTALASATDAGADGFDQAFGLLAPPRLDTVKAKQGWMSYGPNYLLHTTGVLGSDNRYVVVLLTSQSASAGWDNARDIDNQAVATLLDR